MSSGAVASWSVEDVTRWLEGLELGAVAPAFKDNAVAGPDLLDLSDGDLKDELRCTALQVRKIRKGLAELGHGAAAPASSSGPTAAAPAAPAAAPVAAPAPARAPAPPAGPTIGEKDLQKYKQLTTQIEALEKIRPESTLGDAKRSVNHLGSVLSEASRPLPKMEEALKDAQEKLKGLEEAKWYPGKVIGLGGDRQERKVEEQRAEVDSLAGQLKAQRKRVEETEAKLNEAQKVAEAWGAKVSELRRLSQERTELVERIFRAPEWVGREPLATLARQQADLRQQASEAERHSSTYGRAQGLLRQADAKLKEALQMLRGMQMMGGMELMMPGRRNMMMDMREMMMLRRGNEAVSSAAGDIVAARGIIPSLPHVEEGLLKEAQMGLFANVLMGGMMADMMQIAAVRRSMEKVERMAGEVRQALAWVDRNVAAFSGQASQLRGSADAKATEAAAFRTRQLEEALKGTGGSGAGCAAGEAGGALLLL